MWSPAADAGLLAAEALALIVIAVRGDRMVALVLAPLVSLQLLQLLIWLELGSAGAEACSTSNRVYSYLTSALVLTYPYVLLKWAKYSEVNEADWGQRILEEEKARVAQAVSDSKQRAADLENFEIEREEGPRARTTQGAEDSDLEAALLGGLNLEQLEFHYQRVQRLRLKYYKQGVRYGFGLLCVCVAYSALGIYQGWWVYCTTLGARGLQQWPVANPTIFPELRSRLPQFVPTLVRILAYAVYVLSCLISVTLYRGEPKTSGEYLRGWTLMLYFGGCVPFMAFVLWLGLGVEFAAQVASIASMAVFPSALEPWIAIWLFRSQWASGCHKMKAMVSIRASTKLQKESWRDFLKERQSIGESRVPSQRGEGCSSCKNCGNSAHEVEPAEAPQDRMSVSELKAILDARDRRV